MKIFRKLCLIILSLFIVSGCKAKYSDGTYQGKYEEKTQYTTYNANVEVTVEKGKISKVTLKSSNIYSDPELWGGSNAWTEHYQALLNSYIGVDPYDIINNDKMIVDSLAGATLSSERLYKAVKDALSN